jgi:circadian clock protein KaiC
MPSRRRSTSPNSSPATPVPNLKRLHKSPTGIAGFDEITGGGVPQGRPTLICGSAGCGKSLLATEFLIRGVTEFNEPGVLMTFEETADDITKNVASLGFDVEQLIADQKLIIDHVHIERNEIEENGEYDLEGLFIRLGYAIDSIGAKRVVLDTIETLFSGLTNQGILRAELRRLFGWLKERGMTTLITGERGDGALTRQGLEEYVSDCVVLLDHRVHGQVSTRRLRVVKYRGSTHGTNEYPFLIDEHGISVLPITGLAMDHQVSDERITSGVESLDEMLGGEGYYQGSTILLSGTAGTGKTSLAAHLADATCARGERCLYCSFEESPAQIARNMRNIGLNLQKHLKAGLLQIESSRPASYGVEMHLVRLYKLIERFKPSVVVIDPLSNMKGAGTHDDSHSMLIRLIDYMKKRNITAFLVSLTSGGAFQEATETEVSSIVDTWLLSRDIELDGERNRALYVLKARGMSHSNQVREFLITSKGVKLVPAYVGSGRVLTGSARLNQEAQDKARHQAAADELARRRLAIQHRRKAIQAQIEALSVGLMAEEEEFAQYEKSAQATEASSLSNRDALMKSRKAISTHPKR